jgi:hypothetical protein
VDLWRAWTSDDELSLSGIESVSLCDQDLLALDPVAPDCLKDSFDVDVDDDDLPREGRDSVTSEAEASYFVSYDRCSIHKTMIEDETRTRAYKEASRHLSHADIVADLLTNPCTTVPLSLYSYTVH